MIDIYTDGSCNPNPGQGGFGYVFISNKKIIYTGSISLGLTTNNASELSAINYALDIIKENNWTWDIINLYTDSKYVIGILNKNWNPKKNTSLINEIKRKLEYCPNLKIIWIKSHNGNKYNDLADKLAKMAAKVKYE